MTKMRAAISSCAMLLVLFGWCSAAFPDERVSQLASDLKSSDLRVRLRAAMSLSEIGSAAKEAVPELAEAVLDQNLNVRFYAAKTLANIGPDAKAAVPALIKALATFPGGTPPLDGPQRYYADTRWVAAEALGAVGPGAKDAVPALQKALNDVSPDVRSAAAAALKQIQRK